MSLLNPQKARLNKTGWVSGSDQRGKQVWSERLKQAVRPTFYRTFFPNKAVFECPSCGFVGPFKDKPVTRFENMMRLNSKCLGCGTLERHRMTSLVLDELYLEPSETGSMLHIAPEICLQQKFRGLFGTYHTCDLFMPGVDFKEDIQKMTFADASYDCIYIARVLTIPPDLDACLSEMRRVLKPGGIALIAEIHTLDKTLEYGEMRGGRSRVIGMDFFAHCEKYFSHVEMFAADRYDAKYQLNNYMRDHGKMKDDYPEEIRVPGIGYQEVVAVCHA
ncbi:methyltransferase domain-containing protein [Planctomicrobium sp. SH661]|uniref:methyltransferase domain-containing protein n=1 Tax=Planctomicrobium sp. SH661 TaxID=3448124 RepID=UPI003F5B3309